MNWNSVSEDNRRMLKRIIALLFALAGLAERLAGLPRPIRAFVMQILRHAEAVARDFVFETTRGHGVPAPLPAFFHIPALPGGDSPADAMRLAQSFRVLALLLDRLAEHNSRHGNRLVTPAAYTMMARLLAAMRLARRQLLPATTPLTVERRDSS